MSLSLGIGIGDIRIHTTLMYLTKAETWKLAKDLNCLDIIINKTMTDYNGSQTFNEWGFGDINNPASYLRAKGFYEAKENGWI
jgi:7-cyano-7-deazaguanine synthase